MVNTDSGKANKGNIIADNFGGLNRTSSPLNIPLTDSPYLLNVDVDVSGKVRKRKGTRTHWKELTDKRMPITEIVSNLGYSFLVSKLDMSLRVFEVDNDHSTLVWARDGVFRAQTDFVDFVSLPGEDVRVLILNNSQAPVQLQMHEMRVVLSDLSGLISPGVPFNTLGISRVYKNGQSIPYTTNGISIFISNAGLSLNDKIDVVTFSWQWWAESEYWFGDNFHRSIPRSGATLSDQNVAIPSTIFSDIDNETPPNLYGIQAYVTNQYNNKYNYKSDNKPPTAFDYSFGDGSTYNYTPNQSVTPSPFFVTFGRESGDVKFEYTDSAISGTGFFIPDHGLESFDIVAVGADELIVAPFARDTPYYVKKINDNFYELYSDPNLTSLVVPQPRFAFLFDDTQVDTELNRINQTHGQPVGSITPIVFENPNSTLLPGIVANQRYYMFALTPSVFEVYFDKAATRRVDFTARTERIFSDANVVITPSNTITVTNHLLFPKDAVRVYRYTNSIIPGGIIDGGLYFVDIYSPNSLSLFVDKDLANIVEITNTGSGNFIMRNDGGVGVIRVSGGRQTLDKTPFSKVDFSRIRKLPFNNGTGILAGNVYTTVNGVVSTRNLTLLPVPQLYAVEFFNSTSNNPIAGNLSSLVNRIAFTGSLEIGVPRDAIIKITNTEPKWCGSAALATPFNNDNGSWVPVYGLSKFADYRDGSFPAVGAVFQARLVLGAFPGDPQVILFSSRSATTTPDQYYQYFMITDANTTPDVDPFDILLPDVSNFSVQRLTEWQRSLYVFTDNSVYRTFAADGIVTLANRVVGKVSEKGAVNSRCVAVTESSITFLSDNGVYDLSPILEQEYRAAEVSIKVRPYFGIASLRKYQGFPWIAFDKVNLKLFVALPRESDETEASVLLVYDTVQRSWTEYSSLYYFRSYMGLTYTDLSLGRMFMISHKLPCFNAFTRFGYNKYADFVDTNVVVNGQNLITTTPVFWRGQTLPNVRKYLPDLTVNFIRNVNDIRVLVGPNVNSLLELEYGVGFVKSNDGYVELTFDPVGGVIVVVPRVTGTFYGTNLFIDNILVFLSDVSFGGIDFSNPCRCAFGTSTYGGGGITTRRCEYLLQPGAVGEVGYPYLTVYVSPPFTADLLSAFKRVVHLFVQFENVRSRYTADDVNLITQQYSDLVNRAENDLGVNIAMLYQTDNEAEIAAEVYENPYVEKTDSWSVFKEPLQGIGNTHQFVAYSLDTDVWVMNGYQITGKVIGERHISGDR